MIRSEGSFNLSEFPKISFRFLNWAFQSPIYNSTKIMRKKTKERDNPFWELFIFWNGTGAVLTPHFFHFHSVLRRFN